MVRETIQQLKNRIPDERGCFTRRQLSKGSTQEKEQNVVIHM